MQSAFSLMATARAVHDASSTSSAAFDSGSVAVGSRATSTSTSPMLSMSAAATAMTVTNLVFNPLDVVKAKLQTQNQLSTDASGRLYTSAAHCFRRVAIEDGFFYGLWLPGLGASVLQGVANASIRMGLFPTIVEGINNLKPLAEGSESRPPGIDVKIAAGVCTGFLGAFVGNPTDVVKVRLQAEAGTVYGGVLTTGLRQGQAPSPGTVQCFRDLASDGLRQGLLRGAGANCARAALVTSAQMSSYDETKRALERYSVWPFEHESARIGFASGFSGLLAASVAAPADLLRSRIMDDARKPGERIYRGLADCAVRTVKVEGVLALWKGFVPLYMRLGPQFMLAFPLMEFVRIKVFSLPPL